MAEAAGQSGLRGRAEPVGGGARTQREERDPWAGARQTWEGQPTLPLPHPHPVRRGAHVQGRVLTSILFCGAGVQHTAEMGGTLQGPAEATDTQGAVERVQRGSYRGDRGQPGGSWGEAGAPKDKIVNIPDQSGGED